MGCFTVPLATAAVTYAAEKKVDAKRAGWLRAFASRLDWLLKMQLGGSFLLALEHAWHGELCWTPPFLTAVRDGETDILLQELATVGVSMAVLLVVAWVGLVVASELFARRRLPAVQV